MNENDFVSQQELLEEARRANDLMGFYRAEATHRILTGDEEIALGIRIQSGDLEARNQLVQHNLRLVMSIAKRYVRFMPISDLIQEGNLGLIKAAEKFDPSLGYRFSTFATWWIRNSLLSALANEPLIQIPRDVRKMMLVVNRAERALMAKHGREVTEKEIAASTRLTIEQIQTIRRYLPTVSLDEEIANDVTRYDLLANSEAIVHDPSETEAVQRVIYEALALFSRMNPSIDDRKKKRFDLMREVIILAYGLGDDPEPLSASAIAQRLEMTVYEVNELLRKAIAWMQRHAYELRKHYS